MLRPVITKGPMHFLEKLTTTDITADQKCDDCMLARKLTNRNSLLISSEKGNQFGGTSSLRFSLFCIIHLKSFCLHSLFTHTQNTHTHTHSCVQPSTQTHTRSSHIVRFCQNRTCAHYVDSISTYVFVVRCSTREDHVRPRQVTAGH